MIKEFLKSVISFFSIMFLIIFISNLFYLSGQLDALRGINRNRILKLSKEQNDSIASIPKLFELCGKDLKK